jgi:enoyl-CoA hydratase/carnithine racemase
MRTPVALVLAAQGKAFCAGANFGDDDRDGSALLGGPTPGAAHLYIEGNRLFRTKKPIVAAVYGAAVGGGLGLAMVADLRVTCAEARFPANFTRLGFHPGFGLTVTLPAVIGQTKAALMFYTSRRIAGDQAFAMGLADLLVPQEQVRSAVARHRNRRELAAWPHRDARHPARQSCRSRTRSDRA